LRRPTRKASAFKASSSARSLSCGRSFRRPTQPPCLNPSSPVGSWTTPSSDMFSLTTILPMSAGGRDDGRDRLGVGPRLRFRVSLHHHPDHGLGSGRPHQHPPLLAEG